MSATDTVKDVVRIVTTAGLAKDVIDLLDKKVALLADQVASLEQENTTLLSENRNLHLVNEDLKRQLENARPKGDELDGGCKRMLVYIANTDEITLTDLFQWLGLQKVEGEHMFDQLRKRDFIKPGLIGHPKKGFPFHATAAGREYMATQNLLNSKPDRPPPVQQPSKPFGFNQGRMR